MNSAQWNGLVLCAAIAIFSFVMTELLRSVYTMMSKDSSLEQRYFIRGVRYTQVFLIIALSVCAVGIVLGLEFWWALVIGVFVSPLAFWFKQVRAKG